MSLSAIHWPHPGVAVATARAGGVAVLDREPCGEQDLPLGRENLRRLLDRAPPGCPVGLRLRADQIDASAELLSALDPRPHWLVISAWQDPSARARLAALPPSRRRKVWLEIGDGDGLGAADGALGFDGWLAKGRESGGFVGKESAFLLAQRLSRQPRPFLVQGGIGLHSAAACRAAGAAGVVLDDQLLLLRESPLPERARASLSRLSSADTTVVGERLGAPLRIASRPDLPGGQEVARLAEEIERKELDPEARRREWVDGARALLGWDHQGRGALPVGHAVGRAAEYARRYTTTGRFLRALRDAASEHLELARKHDVLAPDSPLARAHGTRYPIVQGPMTRVSDRAEFAAAVADGGALPLLALALMRRPQVDELLRATQARLGDRPWGVGILGFVPPEIRQEQLAAIAEVRPRHALIAGGRPDQAAQLEEQGIPTYLHVPTPALLRAFLERGARRFVFEGSECGGHVGPLTSFSLWDGMIDALLDEKAPDAAAVHALFAGGIHDARSAAMAAAMAAPLAAAGVRVGVLMGTAYLFTAEAVASGAIAPGFQRQALACDGTVTIETGPGHVIRCAPTPFVGELRAAHERMRREGQPAAAISEALEQMTLGRLRIASKGLERGDGGQLGPADDARQMSRGLYMMGDVASLRSGVVDVASLHEDVSAGSRRALDRIVQASVELAPRRAPEPAQIAVIGAACLLPKAQGVEELWWNLLGKVDAIREIPVERWDHRLYYDPDPRAEDRIYSKWGGFLDELPFDPLRYGIPPFSLKSIGVAQLLALEVTRRALADAGYTSGGFDREGTAVIFAANGTADLEQAYVARGLLPLIVGRPAPASLARLPAWSEESYAGILANVVAGRVANQFDLRGPNLTVDAACGSSLAALDLAVTELVTGRSNVAIVGAVELEQTPHGYLAFSKTRAFSPRGRASVFDEKADGIVIGEGVAVLVLKRLADAERDGDRIDAVIQSVAGSSDGKGMGLTAPKPAGQRIALERAYGRAGIDPASIEMYEAHGTGTAVGDRAELETIAGVLRAAGAPPGRCAIGSAKSLLGHTRNAAGLVGVLKALLALRHHVLPPHAGVDAPVEPLASGDCPMYLVDEPRPWLGGPAPRRAGVSAFGFGGTNFHAVLEEYRGDFAAPVLGADRWPHELVVVEASDAPSLAADLEQLARALRPGPGAPSLRDVAFTCARVAAERRAAGPTGAAVCVVADDLEHLLGALELALARLRLPPGSAPEGPLPAHVHLRTAPCPEAGKTAFLFPGQGSQYPSMGREVALYFSELRGALELGDGLLEGLLPARLSRFILPPAAFSEEAKERQRRELTATRIAQPAIGVISDGMLQLALRLGLRPDMLAGHSYGELTALRAAGALSREGWLALSEARGRLMEEVPSAPGAMAAVMLPRAELEAELAAFPAVCIANHNAPDQCVVSGELHAVRAAVSGLTAKGIRASWLPVSSAFHSPLMRPVRAPFAGALERAAIAPPQRDVYASATGRPYPRDPAEIRALLGAQLEAPVDFVAQVRRMYEDGARTFVELGPKATLTGLVRRILDGQPHLAVGFDGAGGGLKGLLQALAALVVAGVGLDLPALFVDRPCERLDLRALAADRPEAPLPGWRIDGGRIRRADEPVGLLGERPLLEHGAAPELDLDEEDPGAGAAAADVPLLAYREHQETMRRFLAMQERVTSEFLLRLGGDGDAAALASAPAPRQGGQAAPRAALGGAPPSPPALAAPPSPPALAAPPSPPALAAPAAAARGEARAPERGEASAPERGTAPAALEPAALRRTLATLVSRRTGYPEDMLGLDQDMEGELGIDSIKRIEILETLLRELPPPVAARLRSSMDRLSRIRSMNGLVEVVSGEAAALGAGKPGEGAPAPAQNGAAAPEPPETAAACPRFVLRAERKELRREPSARPQGLFLVTEDDLGLGARVCAQLAQHGARPVVIPRAALEEPAQIERHVAAARREHGAVCGIVHLASLHRGPVDGLGAFRRGNGVQAKSLFHAVQACAGELADGRGEPLRIVAATLLGGGRGQEGLDGSASSAGCHGILRCVVHEHPRTVAKALGFDEVQAPDLMASRILDELLHAPDDREVRYTGGQRAVVSVAPAPLDAAGERRDWEPRPGWVVLVTGGARGITAEITSRLARPDVRLILVGRAEIPEGELDDEGGDVEALRRRALLEARSAGRDVLPAAIEAEIRSKLQARQRRATLDALRRRGAAVEYHAIDVRDEARFLDLISGVYRRFGRIDAVVHGAGVIEDQLLADKRPDSFDRVFDTKADSTFLLGQALRPDDLKWCVLFSSISGRFGNRGQSDYAAANEVMSHLGAQLDARWPAARVVSIAWGPWREVGMAGEGVLRQLAAQGIVPVDVEAGCRFFSEELAYGPKGDAVVVAGEGPWRRGDDSAGAARSPGQVAAQAVEPRAGHAASAAAEAGSPA
ncbi:type I polyketide synthase [Sorangium cellulosum]|uniref:type I polyketide synthase n=1 Tax=Sorangium cellulosum TaxID=56 RepID=UPI0018F89008|nr:type I polyketide synthase [Sorangium cellulosum]